MKKYIYLVTLSIAHFLFFSFLALEYIYFPPYFYNKYNIKGKEIGIIFSIIPLVGIIGQIFWAQLADKIKKTGKILRISCSIGLFILSLPIFLFPNKVYFLISCLVIANLFISCAPSLIDTIILVKFGMQYYGKIRVWASIGYGFGAWIFSSKYLNLLPFILFINFFIFWLSIWTVGEENREVKKTHVPFYKLFKILPFSILLIFSTIHWSTHMPYTLILDIHRDKYLNLPPNATGNAVFLAILSEILVISTSHKWLHFFPARFYLITAGIVASIRWLLMSFPLNTSEFILLQLLHSLSYGMFFVASIYYITLIIPEEMRATGQSLFGGITFGIGSILGSLYTGIIFDLPGKSFSVFGITSLISLFSIIPLIFLQDVRNNNNKS